MVLEQLLAVLPPTLDMGAADGRVARPAVPTMAQTRSARCVGAGQVPFDRTTGGCLHEWVLSELSPGPRFPVVPLAAEREPLYKEAPTLDQGPIRTTCL